MIAIGNPIRPDGRFVELIRQAERDQHDEVPDSLRVNAIQIPSTDSPHAELDHSPWGLADRTWLEASYRRYGRNSLWCLSHIYAVIPSAGQDSLLTEEWLDWAASQPRAVRMWGIPARASRGWRSTWPKAWGAIRRVSWCATIWEFLRCLSRTR